MAKTHAAESSDTSEPKPEFSPKMQKHDAALPMCCWCMAEVVGYGPVYVLAVDIATAERILRLRYATGVGPVGYAKQVPTAGTLRIFQRAARVITAEQRANAVPKDLAEIDRRGDIDYECQS